MQSSVLDLASQHEFPWCMFTKLVSLFLVHILSIALFLLHTKTHNAALNFFPQFSCFFDFIFSSLFSLLHLSFPTPTPQLFLSFVLSFSVTSLLFSTFSTPLFCLLEVEPYVGTPRWRPLSFCPCCSPEGNVNSVSPGRLSVPARPVAFYPDFPLWSCRATLHVLFLYATRLLPSPFLSYPDNDFQ